MVGCLLSVPTTLWVCISPPGLAVGPLAEHPTPAAPSAGPLSYSGMNWRLPTGYSPGMRGWSCKCCAAASSLVRLGLAPIPRHPHPPPRPQLPSPLSPLPIKAAELWCWRKTGAEAKSDGAK